MNVFEILNNLYTNPKCRWIAELEDDSSISPYLIQRWLAMDDKLRVQVRWLDKYVFDLPSKMYLSLAWSIIPKVQKMPYLNYIKQADTENKLDFILDMIKKQYQMSDNDFNSVKTRLIKSISSNMPEWFKYYGVEKKKWKEYDLDFNFIKENDNNKEIKKMPRGLEAWA